LYYPTLRRTIPRPKLSRLQKICVNNNSKLDSVDKVRNFSVPPFLP